MRCYHINNFYLAGIHAGIQSAHAQHELAIKYLGDYSDATPQAKENYLTWAKLHKTIIVLNGGMQSDLISFKKLLETPENPYAWSAFHESEEALNGALTNLGLVLPESMYAFTPMILKFQAQLAEDIQPLEMVFPDGTGKLIKVRQDREGLAVKAEGKTYWYSPFDLALLYRLSACKLM